MILTLLCVVALHADLIYSLRAQNSSSSETTDAARLSVGDIMAEPSIAGMRPEGERVSPDGKLCAFLWSAEGKEPRDLYVVETRGGSAPRILVRAVEAQKQIGEQGKTTIEQSRDEQRRATAGRGEQRDTRRDELQQRLGGIEWSPSGREILYARAGDLYVVGVDGSPPVRLTRTAAPETNARWLPDGRSIIYQSGGNLFRLDLDKPEIIQVTREASAPPSQQQSANASANAPQAQNGITASFLSETGARVAYILSDFSKQRALVVTDYTGEFVTANTVRRGWSEQTIKIVQTNGESERPVVVKLPAPEGKSYLRAVKWSKDDSSLVVDRIDRDTKRRQLFRVNPNDGSAALIDEETDAKWIAPLSRIVEISPDGKQVLFASERDGFNHLYLAAIDRKVDEKGNASSPLKQLTHGAWEVNWAGFPDNAQIIFSSTADSTVERRFYAVNTVFENMLPLISDAGMNVEPQLSKNGRTLVFQHSEWNAPGEIYSLYVCPGCRGLYKPNRLTDTTSARFKQINWTRPEFVEYRAKDGKTVKARVYLPAGFDKSRKYPLVVFVHGAGYLQNVVNGWNTYYREAMFNSLLAARGYVVLDVDYRGSAGYGREWRTDVYDFLGGLDLQDELDGIDFAVANYAVDPQRVGMYGGSYGGFMSEMAAMRAPEKINCAAALRPVADWKNYYASSPIYTTERLGFPDKNKEAYQRSSPITYADKLQRPLLILHGMVDDNVHFQDSVQLVEKLIELGKTNYFDVMFYPKENHAFTKPESWTDEYERILRFFDAHLQPARK